MGLPSYIINFEELKPHIIDAIETSNFKVELGDVQLNSSNVKINLDPVLSSINKIIEEHKKQTTSVTVGSQCLEKIRDLLQEIVDSHGANLLELTEKIKELNEISNKTNEILTSISEVVGGIIGFQRITGRKISVLSNVVENQEYTTYIEMEKNSLLTGVTIASTSYTDVDSWSLYIGEKSLVPIFEDVYLKPFGDRKDLRKTIAVPKGEKVFVKFNNLSRSGKTIFIDFEYVELTREDEEEGSN